MIVDIRGTHGSGKSWLIHQLLDRYEHEPRYNRKITKSKKPKLVGYVLPDIDTYILGPYKNVCGGCDQLGSPDFICDQLRDAATTYTNVVLEGILVSHAYKRWIEMSKELKDHEYLFAFLNTPLKKCIARVKGRRLAAGNHKPLNPDSLIKDHNQIWVRVQAQMRAANRNVTVLKWQDPLTPVVNLLEGRDTVENLSGAGI